MVHAAFAKRFHACGDQALGHAQPPIIGRHVQADQFGGLTLAGEGDLPHDILSPAKIESKEVRQRHIPLKQRRLPCIQPVGVHPHQKRLNFLRRVQRHKAHIVAHRRGRTGVWHAQTDHIQRIRRVKTAFQIKGHHSRILRADLCKYPGGKLGHLCPKLLCPSQQSAQQHILARPFRPNAQVQVNGSFGKQIRVIGFYQKPVRNGHVGAVRHQKGIFRGQPIHALRWVKNIHAVTHPFRLCHSSGDFRAYEIRSFLTAYTLFYPNSSRYASATWRCGFWGKSSASFSENVSVFYVSFRRLRLAFLLKMMYIVLTKTIEFRTNRFSPSAARRIPVPHPHGKQNGGSPDELRPFR